MAGRDELTMIYLVGGGLLLGFLTGLLSGLIGIGGGALLIPALVFFYGLPQKTAQGTSVATLLLPVGALAFRAYYKAGHVDIRLSLLLALGFTFGGLLGGAWAQRLPDLWLNRSLAVFLLAIAVRLAFRS